MVENQGHGGSLVGILNGKYFKELPKDIQKQIERATIQLAVIRIKGRKKKLEKDTRNIQVTALKDMVASGDIVLPSFQRGKVWDIKKKSELIYSLLTIVIPEIITYERKDGTLYLLDGWQRTSTIVDFLNNEFKLKLDANIEHIDPAKESEEIILKTLFERLNYKSTPLSKYRVVLLTLITSDNYQEMEKKVDLIRETAIRIKLEDRQEANLGFVERVLNAYYVLKNWDKETKEKISKGRSITDILVIGLKEYLEKENVESLKNVTEWIYGMSYLLTSGKPHRILKKKANAEILGLLLYELEKYEPNIFNQEINIVEDTKIEVDMEKLVEIYNILNDEITTLGVSPSKNAKSYIATIEKLIESAEILDWEKIMPNLKDKVNEKIEKIDYLNKETGELTNENNINVEENKQDRSDENNENKEVKGW